MERNYSDFFSTLYDEAGPVGQLGRGTHYSVLRSVVWLPMPRFHDIAVIWDEDHDTRVIWVLEQLYVRNMLPQAVAIGERKGEITVLTREMPVPGYSQQLEAIATCVPSDSFTSSVEGLAEATGIISGSEARIRAYLAGIDALWELGLKDVTFTTAPF